MRHFKTFLSLFLVAAFLAGCAISTHVANIRQRPARFQDRSVTVEGRVTDLWSVPLVPMKFYRVDDGTGDIVVVSNSSRVPRRGDQVRVTGRVESVGAFGGQSVGLHLEQEHLSISGSGR